MIRWPRRVLPASSVACAALLATLPAHGDTPPPTPVAPAVLDALTQIDALPSVDDLDTAFGSTPPLDPLLAIAGDPSNNFGVRLRALGAVPAYCLAQPDSCADGTNIHDQLLAFTTLPAQPAPSDYLWQRAAIEALGGISTGSPDDVALFVGLLDKGNGQDVRASAARALHNACKPPNQCCGDQVKSTVQQRLASEMSSQVALELNNAVQDLRQCAD